VVDGIPFKIKKCVSVCGCVVVCICVCEKRAKERERGGGGTWSLRSIVFPFKSKNVCKCVGGLLRGYVCVREQEKEREHAVEWVLFQNPIFFF